LIDVPGRDLILIHPANDANKELLGCIAPVTKLTGKGKGSGSKKAFKKLKALTTAAFERNEKVILKIQSKKEVS
jgi:hypothetical protein